MEKLVNLSRLDLRSLWGYASSDLHARCYVLSIEGFQAWRILKVPKFMSEVPSGSFLYVNITFTGPRNDLSSAFMFTMLLWTVVASLSKINHLFFWSMVFLLISHLIANKYIYTVYNHYIISPVLQKKPKTKTKQTKQPSFNLHLLPHSSALLYRIPQKSCPYSLSPVSLFPFILEHFSIRTYEALYDLHPPTNQPPPPLPPPHTHTHTSSSSSSSPPPGWQSFAHTTVLVFHATHTVGSARKSFPPYSCMACSLTFCHNATSAKPFLIPPFLIYFFCL